MLLRTWNLTLGNSAPPGRHNYVREMVELITEGGPDVVCLQAVPAWALGSLGGWTRMQEVASRETPPRLGPLPLPRALARSLSRFDSAHLGSHAGEGNAILIPAEASIRGVKTLTLNTNIYCEERGAELGLSDADVRRWQKPRRICHLVQYELPSRRRVLVATLLASDRPDDVRLADAELRRALNFVERRAEVEELVVVAGDFNIGRHQSQTIAHYEGLAPEFRWDDKGAHVDHVMIKHGSASTARVWPREQRVRDGRLLSTHYPIEVEIPAG